MSDDKLPTGKIERASKFLSTGLKVGMNYAKHYSQKAMMKNVDKEELEKKNANDLFDGFAQLRGTALKLAQMLSLDNINLSNSFTTVMQKAQYSVPPMSGPLAVKAFTTSVGKQPEKVFDKFNANAHKAASMGQVHEAMKDGIKMAVKIQYPGVADSVKSDIKLVKSVAHRIVNTSPEELAPYFEEIEGRLLEEADYNLELKNSMEFAEACKECEGIVFPKYYPEYSTNRVITMEWIEGKHLREFLQDNPSSEIRHKAARHLWDFYEFQMHKIRRVNADTHPGNFLFRPDGTIGVLDFGCTKTIDQALYDDYFEMADPHLFDDMKKAQEVLLKLEILRPADDQEKRDKLTVMFGKLILLISKPYHDGSFYFNNDGFYRELTEIGTEISALRELRGAKEFLFINRTYFGLYSLFQLLDVELDTACKYRDFLRK